MANRHDRDDRSFADYQRDPDVRDIYCKRCRYNLRGLMRGECPECGQLFDLTNHRSYATSDQLGMSVKHQGLRRLGQIVGGMSLIWSVPLAEAFATSIGLLSPNSSSSGAWCCGMAFVWPVTFMLGLIYLLNGLLPESMTSVGANIVVALMLGSLAAMTPCVFFQESTLVMLVASLVLAPMAGLMRARQMT